MPIAIGVAKKCCPVCRMLMEILRSKFQINLHIAGSHSRYHPWVPPQWLTEPVLQELEKELLTEVADMATKIILGTCASSPHSDEETAETIPIMYPRHVCHSFPPFLHLFPSSARTHPDVRTYRSSPYNSKLLLSISHEPMHICDVVMVGMTNLFAVWSRRVC